MTSAFPIRTLPMTALLALGVFLVALTFDI